jgi:hypothetical protein
MRSPLTYTPIAETPFEQLVVAVATKFALPTIVALLAGDVTKTPVFVAATTVMGTAVLVAPTQLSNSCRTAL